MNKFAIIENEEYAAISLQKTIQRLRPDYNLVFKAESVEDSVRFFREDPEVDIVFMDIELVDGNSFQIFEQVEIRTPIIFTTAYDQFAIDAFKANSIDYILKPIAPEALLRAITKYETLKEKAPDYRTAFKAYPAATRSRILTTSGDTYSNVEMKEIAFFTRDEKYIMAVLLNGKSRMTDFQNLTEIYEITDHNDFFQLSRNIVASIRAITKVSKWFGGRLKVDIKAGSIEESIIVSAARRQAFLSWFGGAG